MLTVIITYIIQSLNINPVYILFRQRKIITLLTINDNNSNYMILKISVALVFYHTQIML